MYIYIGLLLPTFSLSLSLSLFPSYLLMILQCYIDAVSFCCWEGRDFLFDLCLYSDCHDAISEERSTTTIG